MDERVRRYSMHLELEFKLPVISAVLFLKGGPTGVELRKVEKKIAGRVFNTFHYFAFFFPLPAFAFGFVQSSGEPRSGGRRGGVGGGNLVRVVAVPGGRWCPPLWKGGIGGIWAEGSREGGCCSRSSL